ncbi:hypothetical protein Celal_3519 [Cellulophaga algicola DSM 14237]|uniref:Uncharacterized protein n=1 Tax=Cellulophaga algicola (strain DSM 14237 / IC166 / ACAM 630) TaxID=688270 RepID=E6X8C7_CELAD|nr:hypothetical protein [Cellulophaga algicola]ADV50783.1 hypothetical protein Celal_3519 [Cellulophaga algicola DSM 14237]
MTEFSFKFIDLVLLFEKTPMLMVMWAAFGYIFTSFILLIPSMILRKMGLTLKLDKAMGVVGVIIVLTWLVGFITQMILLFSDVPGSKMFIIWILMLFTFIIFAITNYQMIVKYLNTIGKTKS